tara:strand:+ start:18013 stop:18279 length:267 start_codon:yes stop_codon:yes gene_type:complete
MSITKKEAMEALHVKVADALTQAVDDMIATGEYNAALLATANTMLKNNGVVADMSDEESPGNTLKDRVPFAIVASERQEEAERRQAMG